MLPINKQQNKYKLLIMIQVKNLSKIYKQGELEVKAVNNISMKVYDGEFTAVVGPSGSGKTATALEVVSKLQAVLSIHPRTSFGPEELLEDSHPSTNKTMTANR